MKIGKGYGSRYVNQLYKQVKDFDEVLCFTDDTEGLKHEVKVQKINSWCPERLWWNKVMLFEPGLFNEKIIYVDLDSFIHNSPRHVVDLASEKLILLKTHWFSPDTREKIHMCDVNSSVMVIGPQGSEPLYREWYDNKVKLFKSFYGLDHWIYRRHRSNIDYFPSGVAYSYRYGNQYPDDIDEFKTRTQIPITVLDDILEKDKAIDKLWRTKQ